MESLSRPFHRRKLSNANSFSGKNAYDGVFSGHRPKFDGVPAVNVEEYREIFSSGQAASSIPVLDLSTLQESSDGSNLELGSTKPDYGKIFGGFRDEDVAVSYEELVARDKARAPLSTSQSSQDLDDDLSHQSIDALKQFNMSYNKISQRSKDGLDGTTTTHVTQLHVVPGFTCFIDESASQPKKETKNQKSSIPNNVHSPEKQTSQTAFESKSKYHQDDRKFNLKSHNVKVSSLPTPSAVNTESASQPKMESKKKKSSETDDVFLDKQTSQSAVESESKHHQDESLSDDKKINLESHNSKVSSSSPAAFATNGKPASQPKKETEKKKPSETYDNFLEKQTSQSAVESKGKYHQDESLSDDKKIDLKSNNSKVSSSPAVSATNGKPTLQPKKETEKKKTSETDADVLEKQASQSAVESRSKYGQDESLSDDRISKKFEADINLHFSRGSSSSSSSPATSETNHKDYQKRSTSETTSFWTWKSDTPGAFSSTFFNEELDVNSTAGASAAALRKAIEKAQESIRIAKESVGRKKEGLKSCSSKTFKDSLKVKARVESVSTDEEQKEKDNWIKEIFKARMGASVSTNVGRNHKNGDTLVFSESTDGEKHFGANNEINGKKLESEKNSEMPIGSCHDLKENKIDCDSKEVLGETKDVEYATRSSEEVENNTNESLQKDNQRPNDFLVIESGENKAGDTKDTIQDHKPIELKENKDEVGPSNAHKLAEETNNLTLCQKVEDEKKVLVSHDSEQNGYEKRFNVSLGLLENIKQDVLEPEYNVEVESEESHEPNNDDEVSEKVVEEEIELKEDNDTESHTEEDTGEKFYDVCEVETIENSSSDYDDAEESESIHGANRIETDTAKVDQSDNNNVESSQEVDDVSNSSPQVTVEDTEAINTEEKEIFETICADQTASIKNEDEGEEKSDDEQSESCSDTIHGMEIEIKECKETEEKETIKKEEEEEEINLQESHAERPEVIFEMETGTSEQPKESDSDPNKVMEKDVDQKKIEHVTNEERERERNRLVVERAIREARERAFNEARERVAVERANAEVRQRVMADAQEKATKASEAMKASDVITSKIKAERAAVERATAEARQRALEKAMSQKKVSEPKIEVNDVRQTSSDLHVSNGTSAESAQRSKAKLEKHNRIMERAAKALAEKEKRDQLAQKEQAERNRLAENLDADIKRWSTGKEGNLRALLSTLQYILGPESGWQSVPLTEIITTTAVKKAYRKATLCVHPDKLQQRGASIQHKYICEKVFDLLKAAWNKFNSEER